MLPLLLPGLRSSMSMTSGGWWSPAMQRRGTVEEFEDLHAADATSGLAVDALLDVERWTLSEQVKAVMQVWSSRSAAAP